MKNKLSFFKALVIFILTKIFKNKIIYLIAKKIFLSYEIPINKKYNIPIFFPQKISQDVAIFIPSQLRDLDKSKNLINSLAKYAKVFIFTNKEYKNLAEKYLSKEIQIKYVEDDDKYNKMEIESKDRAVFQWIKFKGCVDMMLKFEKKNNIIFSHILKLRSDFAFTNPSSLLDLSFEDKNKCIVADSDRLFSGRREDILPLYNFLEISQNSFLGNDRNYFPINVSQIINSDKKAYRWNWLTFPKSLFGKIKFSDQIYSIIKKNPNIFKNYSYKQDDKIIILGGRTGKFASEKFFAMFYNFLNIPIKTHKKFLGRLYEKDFSKK